MTQITLNQVAQAMNVLAMRTGREYTMAHVRNFKHAIQSGDVNQVPEPILVALNLSKDEVKANTQSYFDTKRAAKSLRLWCATVRGRKTKLEKALKYGRSQMDSWLYYSKGISAEVWEKVIVAVKKIEADEFDCSFDEMWGDA